MTPSELAEFQAIETRRRALLRLVGATTLAVALGAIAAAVVASGTAAAETPPPAHDVVFARQDTRGAASDLWGVGLDGSRLRRLTFTRNNFDPAYSPNGARIAFASHRPGRGGPAEIYVMNADGTNARRLTRSPRTLTGYTINRQPTWSPDGRSLVYVSTRTRATKGSSTSSTDLWQLDLTTGTTSNITNARGVEAWPSFAANGSLLFVRDGVIYTRTPTAEYLARRGTEPALAPDNGYLAFVANGEIFLTLGQSARKVADGASPEWSARRQAPRLRRT
jgi:dipeptidyl aminopeptidase/acylaminoacyl peptidase